MLFKTLKNALLPPSTLSESHCKPAAVFHLSLRICPETSLPVTLTKTNWCFHYLSQQMIQAWIVQLGQTLVNTLLRFSETSKVSVMFLLGFPPVPVLNTSRDYCKVTLGICLARSLSLGFPQQSHESSLPH